jgi:hypothetical protein
MAPPEHEQPPFLIVSYGGKCLDFDSPPQVGGAPVFIRTCQGGSVAQQVVVQELNDRHEVILRAGTKVIGVTEYRGATAPSVLSRGGGAPVEAPLELQIERNRLTATALASAAGQIFALDGDSIILAADRTRVVKVLNNRGADKTPLVLGSRALADNEFWTFMATDRSNRRPTRGFVRVAKIADPMAQTNAFMDAVKNAKWGTVIEIDADASIDLTNQETQYIPPGVTIRGDRRGIRLGPLLSTHYEKDMQSADPPMLSIIGDHVRITGLRMSGPGDGIAQDQPIASGIGAPHQFSTIIDHNEMYEWTNSAISVKGEEDVRDHHDPHSRPKNVRAIRNFLRHNERWSMGYGVVSFMGAFPFIEGNTFLSNRHAIAADNNKFTAYSAWLNLVLLPSPDYVKKGEEHGRQQDFDMHGTGNGSHYSGGAAGEYAEIARNTFLGTNRLNFLLRGTPGDKVEYHDNVSLLEAASAIKNLGDPSKLIENNNHYKADNPTNSLGVGDFDGDGRDDLFLATGAAWYYAPVGIAEWRFLNAQTDGIGTLLFGDFDADGRTDVFTQHGDNWVVSWGGASRWDTINVSGPILGNAAVGDFDGDHYADVFWSGEGQWFISYRGVGQLIHVNKSDFRVHDLGFGDFNGDGKTDVVGATSGQWMVSLSATGLWAPLRPALTDTMAGLVIADFNGNGRADVAQAYGKSVSYDGRENWTDLPLHPGMFAAVGRFDDHPGVDVLLWNDNHLNRVSGGTAAPKQHSRQSMR